MPAKIPQDVRERQLRELADADGYSFVGWVDEYVSGKSYVIFECQHHGVWEMRINNFTYGSRCPSCGGSKPRTQSQVEALVTEALRHTGCKFVRWSEGYTNQYSNAVLSCPAHGEYTQMASGLLQGKQCYRCSRSQLNTSDMSDKLAEMAAIDGYTFIGFVDEYNGVHGKAEFQCIAHGKWLCSINSFVSAGSRCASCADYGYNPSKPATLYALLSECEKRVKVGITNAPAHRYMQLKSKTPFKFTVHRQLHCEDGSLPPVLERSFHDYFPGVGLRGFDGATEWRVWHDDVNTWFDLLGG